MGVLCFPDLKEKGIPWCRQHVSKLVRLKRFPRPFKLGDKTNAWTDEQIDEYLNTRIAMRDSGDLGHLRVPKHKTGPNLAKG